MSIHTRLVTAAVVAGLASAPLVAQAAVIDSFTTTESTKGTIYNIHPTEEARNMGSSASSHDPGPELESKGVPPTESLLGQITCHAIFAADKPVWNLESWRPSTGFADMVSSRCNP